MNPDLASQLTRADANGDLVDHSFTEAYQLLKAGLAEVRDPADPFRLTGAGRLLLAKAQPDHPALHNDAA